MMRWAVLALTVLLPVSAEAQTQIEARRAMHAVIAGNDVGLNISGNTLTLNFRDQGGRVIDTRLFSGTALVIAGGTRKNLKLVPGSSGEMTATALTPIPAKVVVSVTIRTPDGGTERAQFSKPPLQ